MMTVRVNLYAYGVQPERRSYLAEPEACLLIVVGGDRGEPPHQYLEYGTHCNVCVCFGRSSQSRATCAQPPTPHVAYVRQGGRRGGRGAIHVALTRALSGNVARDVVHTIDTSYKSWYNSIAFGSSSQNHQYRKATSRKKRRSS